MICNMTQNYTMAEDFIFKCLAHKTRKMYVIVQPTELSDPINVNIQFGEFKSSLREQLVQK